MEEKERYGCRYIRGEFDVFIDNETDKYLTIQEVKHLLNQQDKRIKELEKTNKVLSNELTKNNIIKQDHIETCCGIPIFEIPKIKEENQQLKQQLHDLPKKIVGDCKMALIKRINIISGYGRMTIDEQSFFLENEYGKDLDTILKKYGGENESEWFI